LEVAPDSARLGQALSAVVLVAPDTPQFIRLREALSENRLPVRHATSVSDILPASLVLVPVRAAEDLLSPRIFDIVAHCEPVPVALLADRDAPGPSVRAIEAGIKGIIPSAMPLEMISAAIQLILAGGLFLPPTAIRHYVGQRSATTVSQAGIPTFTPREENVLQRVLTGKPNKLIAYDLGIAEKTVKVHIRNIMRKLGVTNRTQIVCVARSRRIQFSGEVVQAGP
jgi:DNA-binding NarL/FixJ family response regulator